MCLTWKILKTLGRNIDMKGVPPKIIFISDLSFELWHLCKSLLPSEKGLSIYFHVILLLCWVIAFSYKHQSWEHYCHSYALCTVNMVCIMTRSLLPRITMFSRCLNFGGALHLYFAVLERASEIPFLLYHVMIILRKCCHPSFVIIARWLIMLLIWVIVRPTCYC